ncbi:MAG: hypothetical protein M0P47_02000 [Bacteroidales bacterium]|nr:hypothetical protein [Bacteroidales bacterium]
MAHFYHLYHYSGSLFRGVFHKKLPNPKNKTSEKVQLSLFQSNPTHTKQTRNPDADLIHSLLIQHLPEGSVPEIIDLLRKNPIQLKVTRHRTSKSGDFRAPYKNQPARITVNGTLNPYAFLITLIHELAHHQVWLDHTRKLQRFTIRRKSRPLPHGKEWKDQFRYLMQPFLDENIFPDELQLVFSQYMENPKASSSADHQLSKILKTFDPPDQSIPLEELPFDAVFSLHGKRSFQKKEKIKTRYRCICLKTNRIYLISSYAPVQIISNI